MCGLRQVRFSSFRLVLSQIVYLPSPPIVSGKSLINFRLSPALPHPLSSSLSIRSLLQFAGGLSHLHITDLFSVSSLSHLEKLFNPSFCLCAVSPSPLFHPSIPLVIPCPLLCLFLPLCAL